MKRLLLVEDNLDNAYMFIRILESAGYEVTHRTHGLEGMRAAKVGGFDMILLDFDLPDIDGSQVGLALRKYVKGTPIVALTAQADKITQNKARFFGFNAFIAKPCTDNDLLNTLEAVGGSANRDNIMVESA